jgi:outer membrane protein assembly factor BamA
VRIALCLCLLCCSGTAFAQSGDVIAEIRVHGNHTTPDAQILAIAALTTGEPADPARLLEAERRLRDSRRFADVEVRRRFRSIDNPSEILVMLIVDEHDAVSEDALGIPGPLARLRSAQMWLPILSYADGYGFTYGARVAFVEPFGARSRVSVPLSWGGERKVGVDVDVAALRLGASINRRINPHFDQPDLRHEVTAAFERPLRPWLRAGVNGRLSRVSFGSSGSIGAEESWHRTAGAQVTVDTRVDPSFPRNAVHVMLGAEHVTFAGGAATRRSADARGYVGLFGASVLALRAAAVRANAPLPASEQLLVGGSSTLRGYRAGHSAGDGLALISAELRVPLTSPLSFGRFGIKTFVDAATSWNAGTKLDDRQFDRGIGAGIYFGATAVQASVDVAWPERGKSRVHVALGVTF